MSTLLAADPAAVIEHHPSPADLPGSPFAQALRQPILLGLFLPIQAGGWSASTLERTTDWRWEYNRDLVLKAEALGFDLVFALSQWLPKGGYGGVFDGNALDSFQTTAALTSITRRILLISTIHVLYGPLHPLHLAVGRDAGPYLRRPLGHQRGHGPPGSRAPRLRHGTDRARPALRTGGRIRRRAATAVARGRAAVLQRPLVMETAGCLCHARARPLLVSATGSDAGIAYAARHSDVVFITSPGASDFASAIAVLPAHAERVKAAARGVGRRVRTLLNPMVISRETESETRAYYEAIVARQDFRTPDGFQSLKSDAHAWRGREGVDPPSRRAIGGNIEVVGTPEQIVEQFVRLRQAGIDGLQLSFFDFKPDLEFFGDRILPLMKQAGLRTGAARRQPLRRLERLAHDADLADAAEEAVGASAIP